jgi:hypothetical protein
MSAFMDLSPEVERALRQLGSQSTNITLKAGRLLVRLALAVPYRDGLRLTSLGHRRYQALPKSPLQGRKASPVIDNILDRAIPAARAAGIFSPMQSTANLETEASTSCSADPKKDAQRAPTSEPSFGSDAMTDRLTEETRRRVHNSKVLLKKTEGIVSGLRRQKQSD